MIGTISEMNWIIGTTVFLFSLMLVPTALKKNSVVPRKTSGPTAIGLFVISFAFLDMGLLVSAFSEVFTASIWIVIFIWRSRA